MLKNWLVKHRTFFFILMCGVYFIAQVLLLAITREDAAFALGIIPILYTGYFLGIKATAFMGAALIVLQPIAKYIAIAPISLREFLAGSGATVIMTLIGMMFGRLSELNSMVKQQLNQMRIQEREKDELQEQLHQAQKMEALGQLAGGIAHDFNNMLCAVSAYSEMIQNATDKNSKIFTFATGIHKAAQRAAEMTANLLAFARRGRFQVIPIDMHVILQSVIELLKHTIDKRIEIVEDLSAVSSVVIGDGTQLQNCILNIALNAKDAMPQGGKMMLSTRIAEVDEKFTGKKLYKIMRGTYLVVSVADNGVGMDTYTKSHAFEPFFTTKELGKGTGLGLASAFGTVKGHGGFIELQSEPGKGTLVDIYLPLSNKNAEVQNYPYEDTIEGAGVVLVIDDEDLVRDAVSEMLTSFGFEVVVCVNGKEGVEYYREHHDEISIVMFDLMMPVMNGKDCFSEIKKINPEVKGIVISGYAHEEEAKKVLQDGACGFLKKPFTKSSLSQVLTNALIQKPMVETL